MAEKLGIGIARYNQIENMRGLNPETGFSLGLLSRFAKLLDLPVSALLSRFEKETNQTNSTARLSIESELAPYFLRLNYEKLRKIVQAVSIESDSHIMRDRMSWLISVGIDLFSLSLLDQLEFEMQIHQRILKSKSESAEAAQQRRERVIEIMAELLSEKK
jgi:transcriptional regulator with XRE-family HTH domain